MIDGSPMTRPMTRPARLMTAIVLTVGAAACGSPTTPTPPPPPPPNSAPVVRSVTVSKAQIDAGQEVDVTAVAEDAETAQDLLQYTWTTEPAGGTFTGQGRSVKWNAPTDGPVPGDYVMRVTVRDAGSLTATGASSAVRVNDAERELRLLVNTFLADFSDSTKSPEYCVRNFTDACPGKASELADITRNRSEYTIQSATYAIRSVQLNSNTAICTYPGGREYCALVISPVHWISTYKPDGSTEHAIGDSWITGVYESQRRQWMLCDSRFFDPATLTRTTSRRFLH